MALQYLNCILWISCVGELFYLQFELFCLQLKPFYLQLEFFYLQWGSASDEHLNGL